MTTPSAISTAGLTKHFRGVQAVTDLTLEVRRGDQEAIRVDTEWELRERSSVATGVEKPFLTAYREGSFHYLLIAADRV